MKGLLEWVKLPGAWIAEGGLRAFRWTDGQGGTCCAALRTLMAIAHRADPDTGEAKLTYDTLCAAAQLSRAKLSGGLDLLCERGIVARGPGRSELTLAGLDVTSGWAKLPAKKLYTGERIRPFDDLRMRNPTELAALKLYLLFLVRRDNSSNMALIGYDRIAELTGVDRSRIKPAISLLVLWGLVHVEQVRSPTSDLGSMNAYRISYLDPYNHAGTRGWTGNPITFDP